MDFSECFCKENFRSMICCLKKYKTQKYRRSREMERRYFYMLFYFEKYIKCRKLILVRYQSAIGTDSVPVSCLRVKDFPGATVHR